MRSKRFTVNKSKKEDIPKMSERVKERKKNKDRINKYLGQLKGIIKGTQPGKKEKCHSLRSEMENGFQIPITRIISEKNKSPEELEDAYRAGFARGLSEVYRCLGATNPQTTAIRRQLFRSLSKTVPRKLSTLVIQQQSLGLGSSMTTTQQQAPTKDSLSYGNISFDDTTAVREPHQEIFPDDTITDDTTNICAHDIHHPWTPIMSSTMITAPAVFGIPLCESTPTLKRKVPNEYIKADDTFSLRKTTNDKVISDLFRDMNDMLVSHKKVPCLSNLRDSGNGSEC